MDDFSPPEFPLRLLKWFCKPDYYLDIEGDLLELFDRRVETLGVKKPDGCCGKTSYCSYALESLAPLPSSNKSTLILCTENILKSLGDRW